MDAPLSSDSSRKVSELYYSGNFYCYDQYYDPDGEEYNSGYYTPSMDDIDTISYQSYISKEEEGRGVIYRMIDEYENDFPFDFKNIKFLYNPNTKTAGDDGANYYYVFNLVDGVTKKWKDVKNQIYSNSLTGYKTGSSVVPKVVNLLGVIFSGNACHNKISTYLMPWCTRAGGATSGFYFKQSGLHHNTFITGYLSGYMVVVHNFIIGVTIDQRSYTNNRACRSIELFNPMHNCHITMNSATGLTCHGELDHVNILLNSNQCTINASCSYSNLELDRAFNVVDENNNIKHLKYANIKCHQGNLTLKTNKTTSTSSALQHIEVDVCNSSNTNTITVDLDSIPVKTTYKTRIAQNSNGDIKMWCDADLVQ